MSSVSVRDVFIKEFSTVNDNDTFSRCLEVFKKNIVPALGVLDVKG
jgi:hypothetical protein